MGYRVPQYDEDPEDTIKRIRSTQRMMLAMFVCAVVLVVLLVLAPTVVS